MTKDRLLAIAGGAACALFFLTVLGGSFGAALVTFFAQLPLYLAGLALGLGPAVIAVVTAVAIVAVVTPGLAPGFALLTLLPALIVVRFALLWRAGADGTVYWYPEGRILGWLAATGVTVLLGATVYFSGMPDGFEGVVLSSLNAVVERLPEQFRGSMTRVVPAVAQIYPGFMISLTLVTAMFNGVVAQWMAVQFGRNIRPTPAYSAVEAPSWLAVAVAVALAGSFLAGQFGYLAQNALIVFAAPFFFVGLAVIHSVSVGWQGRTYVLVVVYLLLLWFGWLSVIVTGVGLLEPFLGLRRRLARKGPDQEEE